MIFMRATLFAAMFLVTVAGVATAQSASCLDVADESHHQLLFQNQDVRVFVLELPRLAATQSHCHNRPYLDIVATEAKVQTRSRAGRALAAIGTGPKPTLFTRQRSMWFATNL